MQTIDSKTFEEVIQDRAVIQFSATWCGPCKTLTKTIEENEGELSVPFYKVDLDSEQALAAKYNVRSVPTLIMFSGGKVAKQVIGNRSLSDLQNFISNS